MNPLRAWRKRMAEGEKDPVWSARAEKEAAVMIAAAQRAGNARGKGGIEGAEGSQALLHQVDRPEAYTYNCVCSRAKGQLHPALYMQVCTFLYTFG